MCCDIFIQVETVLAGISHGLIGLLCAEKVMILIEDTKTRVYIERSSSIYNMQEIRRNCAIHLKNPVLREY